MNKVEVNFDKDSKARVLFFAGRRVGWGFVRGVECTLIHDDNSNQGFFFVRCGGGVKGRGDRAGVRGKERNKRGIQSNNSHK